MLWVLLFAAIALGGLLVLGRVLLGVWRSAQGLLEELDVLAVRADELVGLLAEVGAVGTTGPGSSATTDSALGHPSDEPWPGTVES